MLQTGDEILLLDEVALDETLELVVSNVIFEDVCLDVIRELVDPMKLLDFDTVLLALLFDGAEDDLLELADLLLVVFVAIFELDSFDELLVLIDLVELMLVLEEDVTLVWLVDLDDDFDAEFRVHVERLDTDSESSFELDEREDDDTTPLEEESLVEVNSVVGEEGSNGFKHRLAVICPDRVVVARTVIVFPKVVDVSVAR